MSLLWHMLFKNATYLLYIPKRKIPQSAEGDSHISLNNLIVLARLELAITYLKDRRLNRFAYSTMLETRLGLKRSISRLTLHHILIHHH